MNLRSAGFLIIFFSTRALSAVNDCASTRRYFEQGIAETVGSFDPVRLLTAHDLDVSLMVFHFTHNFGERVLSLNYNGKEAGFIISTMAEGENGSYPTIEKVELSNEFIGKGLGAVLYLATAHAVYMDGGGLLSRSEIVSSDATRFWSRMIKQGFAESHETVYGEIVQMKRNVVSEGAGKASWQFVSERLKP